MSFLGQIVRDTLSIARKTGGGRLDVRSVAHVALHDGTHVLALSRMRQAAHRAHLPFVGSLLRRAQVALFGADIGRDVQLGEGVIFMHTVGVVIGGDARIGDRVMFLGNNTIGSLKGTDYPHVGNDVTVGAGARVLGSLTVGDGAVIGANAVVLRDVPPGMVALGVPATIRSPTARAPREGPSS